MTYLITFSCYGSCLHGADPSTIDRNHNRFGGRCRGVEPGLERWEATVMTAAPFLLDERHRDWVVSAIEEVCRFRNWTLQAIHARTNHVHVVVSADVASPEKIMNDFKVYASRRLNENGQGDKVRHWSRHGSTVYLWDQAAVNAAITYVIERQGEPMAAWVSRDRR